MTRHQEEAEFVRHAPCTNPGCTSSDGMAVYDDGHTHCFVCDTTVQPDKAQTGGRVTTKSKKTRDLIRDGDTVPIRSRKLHAPTAKHFGVTKAKTKRGQPCYTFPYYDEAGTMVAQKLRLKGKNFSWVGDAKARDVIPFGAQAFPATGKQIVVTEGEFDAMAMSQVQDNKWPVVSIPTGAARAGVRKYFAQHMSYFEGFDKVILMFDQDEAGAEATEAACEILGGRAYIARLPLNDPSDMLKADRGDELVTAMWRAKQYRPEGIVDVSTLKDEVVREPEWGLSFQWDGLTQATYGIRLGELHALGAGTGIGKTDAFAEIIAHMLGHHNKKVGVFSLEQQPRETATRILGKLASKPFHVPGGDWTMEEFEEAWDTHITSGNLFLYDSFGVNEWEAVKSKIRYLRDAEDVRYFFLDHLTALAAWQEDERKALEQIMADMAGLVQEVPIYLCFISHLATPDGKPHEEGGRVTIRHFKGSRAIGFWSNFMFGMERDQQADNTEARSLTTFRVLKDRYTGQGTGKCIYLTYDPTTGRQTETAPPMEDHGFKDESDEFGGLPPREEDSDF